MNAKSGGRCGGGCAPLPTSATQRPRLSLLDTVPVGPSVGLADALNSSLSLAHLAAGLGFHRIWIAEHHANDESGCGTPAVLISRLASVVGGIRVGAGGVMLPNHSPLLVAEEFRMLEALFPNRIDLGIGRAKAIDDDFLPALRRADARDPAFMSQIGELHGFLRGRFSSSHQFGALRMPSVRSLPTVFLLGSGEASAIVAGSLGLPFAFAHFQNPTGAANAVSVYHSSFVESETLPAPYVIATVRIVGRESADQAAASALAATAVRLRKQAAARADIMIDDSIIQNVTLSASEIEIATSHLSQSSVFVGDPQRLRENLSPLVDDWRVDELMVLPVEFDTKGRMESIRAIAASWDSTNLATTNTSAGDVVCVQDPGKVTDERR